MTKTTTLDEWHDIPTNEAILNAGVPVSELETAVNSPVKTSGVRAHIFLVAVTTVILLVVFAIFFHRPDVILDAPHASEGFPSNQSPTLKQPSFGMYDVKWAEEIAKLRANEQQSELKIRETEDIRAMVLPNRPAQPIEPVHTLAETATNKRRVVPTEKLAGNDVTIVRKAEKTAEYSTEKPPNAGAVAITPLPAPLQLEAKPYPTPPATASEGESTLRVSKNTLPLTERTRDAAATSPLIIQ